MAVDYATCPIRLSRHAHEQAAERGTDETEIVHVIRQGTPEPAKKNRLKAKYTFPFGKEWNSKTYALKQVQPVFVEEEGEIVVITVYTYYF